MNLFYLCDRICVESIKVSFDGYIKLIEKDLKRLIGAVCTNDSIGAANAQNVGEVLKSWHKKKILSLPMLEETMSLLQSRPDFEEKQESGVSRSEIIRRMEEDRERGKKAREEGWLRPGQSIDEQFEEAWKSSRELDSSLFDLFIRQEQAWSEVQSLIPK